MFGFSKKFWGIALFAALLTVLIISDKHNAIYANQSSHKSEDVSASISGIDLQVHYYYNDSGTLSSQEQAEQLYKQISQFPSEEGIDKQEQASKEARIAWIRLELPQLGTGQQAFYLEKIIAQNIAVFIEGHLFYHMKRDYPFVRNELYFPVDGTDSGKVIYILLESFYGQPTVKGKAVIDSFGKLSRDFLEKDLVDILLGAAFILLSVLIISSSLFMNKVNMGSWGALGLIMFSTGVMIIAYTSYFHVVLPKYGKLAYYMFYFGAITILPALFYFLEKIFAQRREVGNKFTLALKWQYYISGINLFWLILSLFSGTVSYMYFKVSPIIFGLTTASSLLFLSIYLSFFCEREKAKARIIAIGSIILTVTCTVEMMVYYLSGRTYIFYFWKWGILCFVISLTVMLVKQMTATYEQLLLYSKKLEVFNSGLQRTEKMEVISQLSASVAHEVRNPLQVTRGFLQLISGGALTEKEKGFVQLAISELDRAANIITEFLNFAKPQEEHKVRLDVKEELMQIQSIVYPLMMIHGYELEMRLQQNIYVKGVSSKFKQVLINMIKNSIDALKQDGKIKIEAYIQEDIDRIIILIEDNGEGMSASDLRRLGEPFYTKKSQGTGLGLSVSYSIIESMQGEISITSQKGEGTQVKIMLPVS